MNDIERAAIKTYLWWKNRYHAIKNAFPEDDLYQIVSGAPEGGFCACGQELGVPRNILKDCESLGYPEIEIRRFLKEGEKEAALDLIRLTLDTYQSHLAAYLGQQFIEDNKGVFTWR